MSGVPPLSKWPVGRGRGRSVHPNLEFWEDRPGRNPGISHVKCDPVSGNFKLHVRSIPPNWNKTIFKNIFSKCGEPKNIFINPHISTSGLTWGFVEFGTYQEACNAVQQLNNNVLLNIQVMFARERPSEEELDPIIQMLSSEAEGNEVVHRSVESLNDTRQTIKRTVKNDSAISTDFPIEDFHKPILDLEYLSRIEEALFQKILDIYKEGECLTAKCTMCEANCSMACSGCTSVFYCSEDCQNKDWSLHSRNCKGDSAGTDSTEDTTAYSRGGGDQRQTRSDFTNGFGSFASDRENRSDYRPNKFGDRRSNRDGDRGNRDRNQRADDKQDLPQGKKSMFEERKSRIAAPGRQNEDDRGFQNRLGQNNQRSQNGQRARNTSRPRVNSVQPEDDWGSESQDNGVIKDSTATTPGRDFINKEKAFLQEIGSNQKNPPTLAEIAPVAANQNVCTVDEIQIPQPGAVLEVIIFHYDNNELIWVQLKQQKGVLTLFQKLEEHFKSCSSQFSPVKDGICGIWYEEKWYRCQVTNLEPLTVLYIDFGYPEEVEASRLFQLSPELIALPHYAFRIKLAGRNPESFMDKTECQHLVVKLIEKVDSYWLAEVADDKMALPEVQKTEPAHDQPVPVTLESASIKPAQNGQGVAENIPQADTPSQLEPSATKQPSPQPAVQQPFPHMFDASNFTTVVITYHKDSEPEDTYYVGPSTVWDSLAEMSKHFISLIDRCEVLTPKHGTKGLAIFEGQWYRVKVVSLTPPLVYFIDYGNIASLEPEGLRKCPESHKDVPNLVHKIKLAPGTNAKYFNLPDESQIRVKPVSWLPDNTVVVQVEGENYTEPSEPIKEQEKPSPLKPGPISIPSTNTPMSPPTPSTTTTVSTNTPVPAPTPSTTTTVTTQSPVESESEASKDSVQVELESTRLPSTIDLFQEKWKISFVPNKVDFLKKSMFGQVYSEHVPETFQFMLDSERHQKELSTLEYDPNFKPGVGEIVALRTPSGDWERGRVLTQKGLVAFSDQCGVIHSSKLYKLPASFLNLPSMAAVFTVFNEDINLLHQLIDEVEIVFDVTKVISNGGPTIVHVTSNVLQKTIEGEFRAWDYEPLETPDPLPSGELVNITKVLNSNTLLVVPANDLDLQQAIQIQCRITREEFKSTPKEGDYVQLLDKETDSYFRCRIDKVNEDDYAVYCVDNAEYKKVKLGDLRPLPSSLRKLPCRVTQIELKGVDKVDLTEHAQIYLNHIYEEEKCLTLHTDDIGKSTLTVEGEEDTLNNKLRELLKPKVVPDSEGKLTILSLPELGIPLNQEFEFLVTHTEPLYVQLKEQSVKYYTDLHNSLQDHCAKDNALYNPCEGELCLSLFDGEWYRCRCLKETNTGVSVLMLVDYGNMFNAQTSNIRRILPEMLTMPSIATSCKVHDLPEPVSPALKARLNEILEVNAELRGTFVAENDCCYEVVIDAVKQAIQDLR